MRRTVVKIRQTRLMLCSAAMDEGKQEISNTSSVSYSFFYIIKNHIIWFHYISASCIIITLAQILTFILPEAN